MIARCLSRLNALPSCSSTSTRGNATLPSLNLYSLRRRIAEKLSNKYNEQRVHEVGPDLACLEWLMECGATSVRMSDGQTITRQKEMREYIPHALSQRDCSAPSSAIQTGDISYEKQWPNSPDTWIVEVDASDSAIANEGFTYLRDVRRVTKLKLNFCDYFGDEALKFLAQGRPANTLTDLEIVLNPCVTDGAVYWLQKLKSLRRAHFYFLPYVAHRQGFVRQLKIALPRCNVTFPEVDVIGYGYEEAKKSQRTKLKRNG
uniref:ATP synthase subunit s, mitochondrial n=1 Tax=Caenorhabditis japonica TaxID=281687 RepID=A0A8R1DJF0_CAEJA